MAASPGNPPKRRPIRSPFPSAAIAKSRRSGISMARDRNTPSIHSNLFMDSSPLLPRKPGFNCCLTNKKSMGLRTIPKLDYGEFENMPPALRRKLFSSYERLQLASKSAQQAATSRPSIHHTRNMSSASVIFKSRPSHDSFQTLSPRAKLKKSHPSADTFFLSHADAKWFLELPETIKRKHFTREERILLAAQCQDIIMDATDETLFRLGRQANRSNDTINTESTITQRASGEHCDDWRNSFRWLDENDNLDLGFHLDEYHESILEKTPSPTLNSNHSRRRTFSLSARPKGISTTAQGPIRARRSASHSVISSSRASLGSSGFSKVAESPATYYQDPEARLKLRVYLASAQKFDEAIEFGFPSASSTNDCQNPRTRSTQNDAVDRQTVRLDNKSFLLDESDDRSETDCLYTKYHPQRLPKSDSTTQPPTSPRKPVRANTTPYLVCSPGSREMTLRMTLTRPDLRADENELYGWEKEDPLVAEDLPLAGYENNSPQLCDAPWNRCTGPGLVKKIWRRVKRR